MTSFLIIAFYITQLPANVQCRIFMADRQAEALRSQPVCSFFSLCVRPSVCYETCGHDILEINEPQFS